jgi:phospholipid-transporting ATPase
VGVGISGLEGLQAVMSSDYAIAQFRYLQRLLLVHGSWSYSRLSVLILFSFMKNVSISVSQIWFALDCGFSGQMYYDAYAGSAYNIIFTSFPVMAAAIFNRDVKCSSALENPKLYMLGQRNTWFGLNKLFHVILEGIYNSIIVYYFSVKFFEAPAADGLANDQWVASSFMYSALIFIANIRITFDTLSITIYSLVLIPLSVFVWFLFAYAYEIVNLTPDFYGIPGRLFPTSMFWLGMIVTCVAVTAPKVSYLLFERIRSRQPDDPMGLLFAVQERDHDIDGCYQQESADVLDSSGTGQVWWGC